MKVTMKFKSGNEVELTPLISSDKLSEKDEDRVFEIYEGVIRLIEDAQK